MKTAFAALGTALVFATSASAMVGTYERAVNSPEASVELFTTGQEQVVNVSDFTAVADSPQAEWNNNGVKTETLFDAAPAPQTGAYAR